MSIYVEVVIGEKYEGSCFVWKREVRIDDFPEKQVGDNDIKVAVSYCSICGTDFHKVSELLEPKYSRMGKVIVRIE